MTRASDVTQWWKKAIQAVPHPAWAFLGEVVVLSLAPFVGVWTAVVFGGQD